MFLNWMELTATHCCWKMSMSIVKQHKGKKDSMAGKHRRVA